MTKRQIIRMVAFVLVVCCILVLLCDLFERDNSSSFARSATTFRNLNKNTLDAVWIGTSGVDRYWIGAKAYEEYGMTVYPYSSDAMPAWLILNRIKEVYRKQSPELIILDVRPFTQSNTNANVMQARARRILDTQPFMSREFLENAFTTMNVLHEEEPDQGWFRISLLLSFVKYHTMWAEKDYSFANHLGDKESRYGGYYISYDIVRERPQELIPYSIKKAIPLDTTTERCLYDVINYARENNIELLFVDTPQYKTVKQNRRSNRVYQILDEEGMKYINYCLVDKNNDNKFLYCPEISHETDFYSQGHVNYYGAVKFTDIFAKYLDENYDFPDHRNEEAVKEDWDPWYENILAKVASYEEIKASKKKPEKDDAQLDAEDQAKDDAEEGYNYADEYDRVEGDEADVEEEDDLMEDDLLAEDDLENGQPADTDQGAQADKPEETKPVEDANNGQPTEAAPDAQDDVPEETADLAA